MFGDKIRQFANLWFAIALPLVAVLVNLEITGPSIGRISARYPTYVVPAGYAFSIWNLIFALSLGYAIWQVFPAQRENPLLRRVGWLTASAFAATSIWMLVFQYSLFALSVLVILWLLASLIGVIARVYQHDQQVVPFLRSERMLVYVNFSIFLGWITIATVANIAQTITAYGWNGWGVSLEVWGLAAVAAAGVIASVVTAALKGNVPYALTTIWAFIGIAVNQFSHAVRTSSAEVGALAVGMAFLIGITLLVIRTRHMSGAPLRA